MDAMNETPDPADDRDIRLGSLALRARLVTPAQLKEALSLQAREATEGRMPRQLGLILLSMGLVTEQQLLRLLNEQQKLRGRGGQ
jgi:hypothetical protein